jgi:hypothetical protein
LKVLGAEAKIAAGKTDKIPNKYDIKWFFDAKENICYNCLVLFSKKIGEDGYGH